MSQREAKATVIKVKKRIMDKGFKEFIAAIEKGDLEKVKELFPLYRWAFTSTSFMSDGNPLLISIGFLRDLNVFEYFLENGVDPNQIPKQFHRPIYFSILVRRYACIPLLIEAKANVNDIIGNGKTALDMCLAEFTSEPSICIHLLLDYGAKHNHPIPEKQLPLFTSRQSCKTAARTLYVLLRRRLRVSSSAYPSGWPIPAALALEMARLVWATRRDANTWSEQKKK